MDRLSIKRVAIALAMLGTPVLVGCGGANPTPVNNNPNYQYPGGGYYPGGGGSACLNTGMSQIGFTLTNVSYYPRRLTAGQTPSSFGGYNQGSGQVMVNGAGYAPTPTSPYGNYNSTTVRGQTMGGSTLQIQLSPGAMQQQQQCYPGQPCQSYYYDPLRIQGVLSGTGVLALSGVDQQQILYSAQSGQIPLYQNVVNPYTPNAGYGGYPGYYPQQQQMCVTGLGMNLTISLDNQLYMGEVYLFMNNTMHGMALPVGRYIYNPYW